MNDSMGLTARQLELRRTGISATDAVILSGCSCWGNPLEVWEQKMGAPSKPQTLAMAMGHAAEPVVMNLLAQKYGLVMQPGATVRHRIMRHFLATPDRFVSTEPVIVDADDCLPQNLVPEATCEGKLVGWHLVKEWRDETDPTGKTLVFPDSVAVQTTWQMGVTGTRRNYVAALLGGWRDEDFHHLAVDFNEELWLGVVDVCDRFWKNHVLARIPPPPDASDRAAEVLGRIYPSIKRPVLMPMASDMRAKVERYLAINCEMSALGEEKSLLANQIRAQIADAEGFKDQDFKATWLPQKGRVSMEKLAAAYKISEQQLDQFRSEPSRVLRVSTLSKREKAYGNAVRELAAE